MMKTLALKISDELHKKLKLFAIQKEQTMTEIVETLITNELKKKEQTQ